MKKIYLLALIMAVIAGISVYMFAMSLQQDMKENDIPKTFVVVAAVDIPADTQITSEMVAAAELPLEAVHGQAVRSLADAVGKISQYPIAAQEQVLSNRLKDQGAENNKLSYVLESGYRAITLSVDNVTGVSGYISRGDRVDLVTNSTYMLVNESRVVVENLLVLRLGINQAAGTEGSAAYTTITLAATPDQVLQINQAMNSSRIAFVLRSVLDKENDNPEPFSKSLAPPDTDAESQQTEKPASSDSVEDLDLTTEQTELLPDEAADSQ